MEEDVWDKSIHVVNFLAIMLGLIGGLGILGFQIYFWLKYGNWLPLPLKLAFAFLNVDLSWVYTPHSWQGVAKIVRWVLDLPLSLVVPGLCFLVSYFWKVLVNANIPNQPGDWS